MNSLVGDRIPQRSISMEATRPSFPRDAGANVLGRETLDFSEEKRSVTAFDRAIRANLRILDRDEPVGVRLRCLHPIRYLLVDYWGLFALCGENWRRRRGAGLARVPTDDQGHLRGHGDCDGDFDRGRQVIDGICHFGAQAQAASQSSQCPGASFRQDQVYDRKMPRSQQVCGYAPRPGVV